MAEHGEIATGTNPDSGVAKFRGFKLHYTIIGHGTRTLFAFHGFGQSNREFANLNDPLGKEFRIYSFSLFFHGRSIYPLHRLEGKPFSKRHLKELIQRFIKEQGITKFSTAGYSLGGRFALAIAQLFPEQTEQVFLFASEGLEPNRWINFFAGTGTGKKLFRWYIRRPGLAFSIMKALPKAGLLEKKISSFIREQSATREQREQVLKTWISVYRVQPDLATLKELSRTGKLPEIHLFFGKYDKIIPVSLARRFVKKLGKQARLHIIYTGHMLLGEKTRKYLLKHPEIYQRG